uniref:BEN domain containing 2 n=1 Tax=Mus spicilegus TaxID=10103 RepID=A0A8C6MT27_MUSSI
MESDTDDSHISDDGDELFSEDFGSDIEDTSSFEGLTVDSELEDSDLDSFVEESLSEIEDEYDDDNGADGDEEDDDEDDDEEDCEENLPENLKRFNSSPLALPRLTKRRRSSSPDSFMQLQELLERTNRQITNIYEAVSRIHEFCGVSQMERCRNCDEQLTPAVPAVQDQSNPEGTVLQPVAEAKPAKLDPDADIEPSAGGAQETNTAISSDQPAVEAPPGFQQPVDSTPAHHPSEIPEVIDASCTNNNVIMNKPTFEKNQQDGFSPPVYHNFGIPVIPEAVLVNNPGMMDHPPAVGNSSGHQNLSSSTGPIPDSEIKEVVLLEMPGKTEVIMDGTRQTAYYPALLGNVVPPDPETVAASISSESEIEKLVLVEVPIAPESILDDSPETLNNPVILQHARDQERAAESFVPSAVELLDNEENNAQRVEMENDGGQTMPFCVYVHSGVEDYLGDPRRSIRLDSFHLVTAKNKPTPTYAACYLANVIFSEEILLLNSIGNRTSRCILMDQNKMSAIREYLLTVFPDYDLSEKGKAWNDCVSAISFMIQSLYTDAEIPTNRNFSVPMSTNWYTRSNNDGGVGPSQWLQDVRESVKRERVDFEHTPDANPEGSDNASINPDQLVYLGDPSRDIQIPYSVLKTAKSHLRPDLSAKYIVLHLFPEEVLIASNVYGNMECGLFALDPNRIDALREFLQDNYPEYELEETGYYWKLCVTAINGCLQTLRQGPRNAIA